MFKLEPFISTKIWGYERWLVSTHPAGESMVVTGTGKPEEPLSCRTGDYPLLIKVIQANETLSVQVHPDDTYARIHENSRGKTECWYILDAQPDTKIICGMTGNYSMEELKKAITENRFEPYLRSVPVKRGDLIFIPAGTVHAINGGLRLLEVQESSDITYRLYDWGRGREVHIEKGIEVIKNLKSDPVPDFTGPFNCGYFTMETLDTTGTPDVTDKKDFILFVISGTGTAECAGYRTELNPETTLYCVAGEQVSLSEGLSLMKITAGNVAE